MSKYIAQVGMDTPAGRFEAGEEVKGIPPGSVKGLLKRGAIIDADEQAAKKKAKPKAEPGGGD
jgi:hypothetical protein